MSQYSLAQILAVWAFIMAVLMWRGSGRGMAGPEAASSDAASSESAQDLLIPANRITSREQQS